nr:transposase [Asticcacaulis excentricus]
MRHRDHGASSEKVERKIEQYELMLEEIEATRAEAEARSGKDALPEAEDEKAHPKRKPLPDNLPREDKVYEAPCDCPTSWQHVIP